MTRRGNGVYPYPTLMNSKPPSPRPKLRISVCSDSNLQSLMAAIEAQDDTEIVKHPVYRAALRLGLAVFARSPETKKLALAREEHRYPLEKDVIHDRAVKEVTKALEIPARRAS